MSILYPDYADFRKVSLVAGSMWREVFGKAIEVQYINQEWKGFLASLGQRNFMLAYAGWLADYDHPSAFLNNLSCQSALNPSGYCNPAYDELLNRARHSTSAKRQLQSYQQAEQLLAEDMPMIPLYQASAALLVKPNIGGFAISSLKQIDSKRLYIRKKPSSQTTAGH